MSDLVKSRADFFVTGNEYIRDNLDLKFIPRAILCPNDTGGGVMLASDKQNLQQSYEVAKDFFAHAEPKTIKFVLIGLSPDVCPIDEKILGDYFKLCIDNGAKPVGVVLPVNSSVKKDYNADALKLFRDLIKKVAKKYKVAFIDLLDVGLSANLFKDKWHLNSEGALAVTALLSERLYFKDVISPEEICNAGKEFFNILSKFFSHENDFWSDDKPLHHHIFCKMTSEDFNRLSKTLPKQTCMDLMTRVFYELPYSYLVCLAEMLSKDDYTELTTRLFSMTVESICRKDKIKVGFYFDYSSHWCGDELYNLFARDERFELTIFIPTDKGNELNRDEFLSDSKRFNERGLNVFEMKCSPLDVPKQDILFRFRPYPNYLMPAFSLVNLKVKESLLLHLPYSFFVVKNSYRYPLCSVLWKAFLPSIVMLERYRKYNKVGVLRGIYSGYPKMDIFFKSEGKFQFNWKMARAGAKKIIWAPHWTVPSTGITGIRTATFQWNYQFMYECAKSHPEISWVVKPHPMLFKSAVRSELFPSTEALRGYFQKWDELPNAQFYMGTYYQSLFATSDGMIHDCCSFTAEYQYVDKPMVYLTRKDSAEFDELGKEILKASYTVDGQDLEGIAAMIQRVFIEGDDYKAAERKAVFDKHLNYPIANGMLASEFIFKSITDELKLTP